MSRKSPKTNPEIIAHVMEFSRTGPLAQLLIVEAIRKYCEQVTANADRVIEQMENGFISGPAWVETARVVALELQAHYDRLNKSA